MKSKRAITWVLVAVGISCVLVVGFMLRFPPGPCPWCHKMFDAALEQWKMAHGNTHTHPNINGEELPSIAEFAAYVKDPHLVSRDYGYIPGLRDGDPDDLILMYMRKKTRHTWHGDHSASILTKPKWMVLGPQVINLDEIDQCPEGGRLLSTDEFTDLIRKTLDFLKENDRPNWETVTKEHTVFLKSIKE